MSALRSIVGRMVLATAALLAPAALQAQKLLIPMDLKQANHLKAYGIAFWALTRGIEVDWLLNYRSGSFMIDGLDNVSAECRVRGVTYEQLSGTDASAIYAEIQAEDNNMDVIRLEKAPKIAVYVPPNFLPWDDAVTLAMEYAEIPYAKVWDDEVLRDSLSHYDWLDLHLEDFSGLGKAFFRVSLKKRGENAALLRELSAIFGDKAAKALAPSRSAKRVP